MSDLKKAFKLIGEGLTLLQSALDVPAPDGPAEEKPARRRRNAKKDEAKGDDGKKKRRRKAAAKAAAEGPTIDDARSALLEVVEAFEDGNEAVVELLGEIEEGIEKISELDPSNYQKVIDAAKQYLADSEEDDD